MTDSPSPGSPRLLGVDTGGTFTDFVYAAVARRQAEPAERLSVHGVGTGVPVHRRSDLAAGQRLAGPAIVTGFVATTWIEPGWSVEVGGSPGNLLLSRIKRWYDEALARDPANGQPVDRKPPVRRPRSDAHPVFSTVECITCSMV